MSLFEKFILALLIILAFVYFGSILLYCLTEFIEDYYDEEDYE